MKYRIYNIKYTNGRRGERSFIIESKKPISKTQIQESIFKKTNKTPLSFNVDLLTLNEKFSDYWNAIKDTAKSFSNRVNKNADIRLTKETIPKLLEFINELKEDISKLDLGDISEINKELDAQYDIFKNYKLDDEQ